jgi:hypothetical protein
MGTNRPFVVPIVLNLIAGISEPGPNRPTYYRPDGSHFTW